MTPGYYVTFFNKKTGLLTGQLHYNTEREAMAVARHARATRRILKVPNIIIRVVSADKLRSKKK